MNEDWLRNLKRAGREMDGAPAHFGRSVREFLNNTYEDRWIGRLGPVAWPPRSPDLTPLDFFLWEYVKQKVYGVEIESVDMLRDRIQNAFEEIKLDGVCASVQDSLLRRLQKCVDRQGDVFEHLL
ncbi:uncharacterized protein LOC143181061 [Calliopsis andreniformis]|uniref:uncharacterized protein LOC143181061 n=1 Tax=Calliopsis andreniformis TaxID=337506 RepID=UPI003FCEDC39